VLLFGEWLTKMDQSLDHMLHVILVGVLLYMMFTISVCAYLGHDQYQRTKIERRYRGSNDQKSRL
jgi:hypothetical protein